MKENLSVFCQRSSLIMFFMFIAFEGFYSVECGI